MSNWATINELNTMQSVIDELRAENDKLRAQLLKAPDAKMVAFVAEFELWLESGCTFSMGDSARGKLWRDILATYSAMKAQYLDETGETS